MKEQVIIRCQYKEWYGCDENVGVVGHGRHKNKGGHDIVVEMDYMDMVYSEGGEQEFLKKFNEEHDQPSSYVRYEALEVEPYTEPAKGELVDGKIKF